MLDSFIHTGAVLLSTSVPVVPWSMRCVGAVCCAAPWWITMTMVVTSMSAPTLDAYWSTSFVSDDTVVYVSFAVTHVDVPAIQLIVVIPMFLNQVQIVVMVLVTDFLLTTFRYPLSFFSTNIVFVFGF